MRYLLGLVFFHLFFLACTSDASKDGATEDTGNQTTETAASPDWSIKPGFGFGVLSGEMDREAIEEKIGKDMVVERDFYLGEGESAPGLALYPDTPEEIEVLLDDDGFVILYRQMQEGSKWATDNGIKVGTSIQELQAANGKPFKFTGFDWDYGGTVTNWNGGTFDGTDFLVVLDYNYEGPQMSQEDTAVLLGDQEVVSDQPAAQKYEIKVAKIMQRY